MNDGNSGGNYTVSLAANATGVISPAAMTITATPNTKLYDGTTSAAAVPTVSGLQGSDTVTGLAEVYDTKDAGIGKTLSVSAYTINDGNTGGNYTVSTVVNANSGTNDNTSRRLTGIIIPTTLTVTADNKSRFCGQANPVLTASYTGFVNGEDAGVLTSAVVLNTTATIGCAAGEYPITAGGADAANYTIQYVNGTLMVAAVPQLTGTSASVNGNTQFIVSWGTVSGYTYQLEYKDDLMASWQPFGSVVAGNDATVYVTNNVSDSVHRFFRLGVQ